MSNLYPQDSLITLLSLTCTKCMEDYSSSNEYRLPIILSCGHTFCKQCVTELNVIKNLISCPMCCKETLLGYYFPPVNFLLTGRQDRKEEGKDGKEPWYTGISIGDHIDVCGSILRWIPAEILARHLNLVRVHYTGWSSSWDEWVSLEKREKTAPLGTYTGQKVETKYKVGNEVEIKISDKGITSWVKGKVYKIVNDELCVKYVEKEKDKITWINDRSNNIRPLTLSFFENIFKHCHLFRLDDS